MLCTRTAMRAPALQRTMALAQIGLVRRNANLAAGLRPQAQRTALYQFHVNNGGKMTPFAGWDMPVRYSDMGDVASHMHCRQKASLFDVSHMLQTVVTGRDRVAFLESLVVADLAAMPVGSSTLSLFTSRRGGIIDDTVINVREKDLYVVSNAGCAEKDKLHLTEQLFQWRERGRDVDVQFLDGQSLIALQGPAAASVLAELTGSSLSSFNFMTARSMTVPFLDDQTLYVSRCGYTGEDGFEIQIADKHAVAFCTYLLGHFGDRVRLAGLGARDSLRLEAGLCLYGHDIDEDTSPVEAGLAWTIGARRRREGGFLGADVILPQLEAGASRRRVGFLVEGRPARQGALVVSAEDPERRIGVITSGCPSPSLGKNIAMGYVESGFHKRDTPVKIRSKDRLQDAVVSRMPFVPHRYHRV